MAVQAVERTPAAARPALRRGVRIVLGVVVAAILLLAALAEPGDRALYPAPPGSPTIDVYVLDHGYHAGLVVPVDALHRTAAADGRVGALATSERFLGRRYVELGWGDEGFYRQVPTIDKLDWRLAVAALTNLSRPPVLHVGGFDAEPRAAFPRGSLLHVSLSEAGFERLVRAYDETIVLADGAPLGLGPGLYEDSEFYRATGLYNALDDCNQWVAKLLAAAGLPVSRATATTSFGLMAELRWRAGAD